MTSNLFFQNNINYTTQDLFLLMDESNCGVLCTVPNFTVGTSIAKSHLNLRVISFPTHDTNLSLEAHRTNNFNNPLVFYYSPNRWNIELMPETAITNSYKTLRIKIFKIKTYHEIIFNKCHSAYERCVENILLTKNLGYLKNQLQACDPHNNFYTDAIQAHAHITNCDNETAYIELKMLIETEGLKKTRLSAIYMKYVNAINNSNETEIPNILNEFDMTLNKNAWI